MARTDNLTNYLTDIATAIKTKKGDDTPIKASEFDIEIENLPSGGDTNEVARKVLDKTITEYVDDELSSVGANAFYDCESLTKLHIHNAKVLGNSALYGCSELEDLDISNVTEIGNYAFNRATKLSKDLYLPNCQKIGANPFGDNGNNRRIPQISKVIFPNLTTIVTYSFGAAYTGQMPNNLKYIDCGTLASIPNSAFTGNKAETIILRKSDAICTLENISAFSSSEVANGTSYIYVPKALLEEYKNATNWVTYANQIRAIEDYPEIVEV